MPIVNPHNEDTAVRDEDKILQRDADWKVLEARELELKEQAQVAIKSTQAADRVEFEAQKKEWARALKTHLRLKLGKVLYSINAYYMDELLKELEEGKNVSD